jgi:prepilin-type N-terminal cleavage/methylation domain-containing protein
MSAYKLTSDSKQSGFTLLEILIAITLLAFITIGVVNITDNAAQTKERTTEVNENNLQIETAMSRFEWDFSQIYSPLYFSSVMNMNQNIGVDGQPISGTQTNGTQSGAAPGQVNPQLQQYYEQLISRFERNEHFISVSKDGHPIPRFYAPEKSIFEFFTTSNRRKVENTKQSHFAWVRYSLADQEQTEEEESNTNIPKSLKSFVRYFSADDPYGDQRINVQENQLVKAAVLLRNVEYLEFQFWDYQRRKWETNLRNIESGESLVRGVKLIITWYDSQGAKRSSTRIFRTLWPMVTPQDQIQPVNTNAGIQAGAQGGSQGNTNLGSPNGN